MSEINYFCIFDLEKLKKYLLSHEKCVNLLKETNLQVVGFCEKNIE